MNKRKNKFVEMILDSCENQFPKKCSCCGRIYETFSEFLENTSLPNHSKDHSLQLINFKEYKDVIALRNCRCGSTISIQCVINPKEKNELMQFIVEEAKRQNVEMEEIALQLRNKVIKMAEMREKSA